MRGPERVEEEGIAPGGKGREVVNGLWSSGWDAACWGGNKGDACPFVREGTASALWERRRKSRTGGRGC